MADPSNILVASRAPLKKNWDQPSACLEVEIVASPLTGGIDETQIVDHALNEEIHPMLKRAARRGPDMGGEFKSPVELHHFDIGQRSFGSAPQDVGECKMSTKSISTESHEGTSVSQASVAFKEELSLIRSDKGKSLDIFGSQVHRLDQQLQKHSKTDKYSSVDKSLQFAADGEFTLFSTNCSLSPSSNSFCRPQRRSSRLLSKRRRTCNDSNFIDWEFEKVKNVVLLDDEDLPGRTTDGLCDEWKEVTIYYPSRDDPESVELSHSDVHCLNPEQYLSSPIMNFYIQYLHRREFASCRPQGEHHIFNTFFYGKLQKAMSHKGDCSQYFLKLRRWWKGVNLFSKSYIILPIHGSSHWSLVIICIPGKEDESGPLVLHLDSLGLHSSQHVFNIVSNFLKEEWNCINQNHVTDIPFAGHVLQLPRIEKKKVMVPQQKNEYDCGIFVLYFIKRFLEEAPQRLRKQDLSMFSTKWFKPSEASSLRKRIQELLIEEFKKSLCHTF
ncbi:hypothetical protein HPP92_019838 [Vanilla planifolia]|uniref:Ubiquitin-like protease family profile domain-containing protein n=1 Tax=Vanilla planifolia TaxID=51239 RepID=A0A835Q9R9_VANPL|nr:hypothetical protein HPP92_019838 [Vanilla planifolia]